MRKLAHIIVNIVVGVFCIIIYVYILSPIASATCLTCQGIAISPAQQKWGEAKGKVVEDEISVVSLLT